MIRSITRWLPSELIGDAQFVVTGLRRHGGFAGQHDALWMPDPEHISAARQDLPDLLVGLTSFERDAREFRCDPVLTAASMAFGFASIHPFEDGNRRIHRFLMHHVLAERDHTPDGIGFPISNVVLDDIVRYKGIFGRGVILTAAIYAVEADRQGRRTGHRRYG